jgi:hypothetical protein
MRFDAFDTTFSFPIADIAIGHIAQKKGGMQATKLDCAHNGLRGKNQAGDGAAIAAERSE